MKISILCDGPFATNGYVLSYQGKAVVIDPNFKVEPILKELENLELQAILLTHGHIDHISALNELKEVYKDVPVYLHPKEEVYLTDPSYNLSSMLGETYEYHGNVSFLNDGDEIDLIDQKIKIMHTPGHTLGSLSYYFIDQNAVFSGDVLFKGSVGRTDFKGCLTKDLLDSIEYKLCLLPHQTEVYSGHGIKTTIGEEIQTNPFIKIKKN